MFQVLDWKKYNALDFELKIFRLVRIWKIVCTQKSCFSSFYSVKTTYFVFLCFLKKHDFESKISLCVRFSIEKNTSNQIFKQIFYNASDFEWKILQRVRF